LSFISTIGRTDFNAAVALFGILFHKTFDATQRSWVRCAIFARLHFVDFAILFLLYLFFLTWSHPSASRARAQYMYALFTCIFFDLVWLNVAGGVSGTGGRME
jgi:hypothetical protein